MSFKLKILPALNLPTKGNRLIPMPNVAGIPKIIHQTYHKRQLPQELEANVKRLQNLNPGWEYRFYDDNDIIDFIEANYGSSILSNFNRVEKKYGAARADIFRYLLMYKCGGVYLDIKSSASKPFDDIISENDQYLLSHWNNKKGEQFESWGQYDELADLENGEFQQWFIACSPGHQFLKAVIENVLVNLDKYNPALHGVGKIGVLRLTGPIAYSLAIVPILTTQEYRLVDSERELGLQYSLYKEAFHTKIFKTHYSQLTESIVRISYFKEAIAWLINALRRVGSSVE